MSAHLKSGNASFLTGTTAVLAVFATILGFISAGDNVLGWDLSFAVWIQQWQGGLGESLYRVGDVLGTTSVAAAVIVVALVIALLKRHVQISAFLLFVLVLRLLGIWLKPLFNSPRPTADHVRLLETYDGTGYPSGHSMTVAMVATVLVVVAWRYLQNTWLRCAITVAAVLAIILVGWSRIWSGAHWPSDVLGGWSFGIALVLIAWMASEAIAAIPVLRRDTAAADATSSR